MMLEGKGMEIIDLGTDVPAETYVQAAIDNDAQFICCSALLTTTMGEMKNVVELAKEKGIRDKVTIMVGGAPVNESFCQQIGADIYTADAASAADAAMASWPAETRLSESRDHDMKRTAADSAAVLYLVVSGQFDHGQQDGRPAARSC